MTHDTSSLRERSVSGVKWTATKTVIVGLIGPLSTIVKGRFLTPNELGGVAVVLVAYGLFRVVENAGLSQTVVQKDDLSRADVFTYAVLAGVLGLVGASAVFGLSGPIERLTGVSGSGALLRIASPIVLFSITDQFLRALLHRSLSFRGPAVLEMTRSLVNVVILFGFLLLGYGPVAVVFGLLGSGVMNAVGLLAVALRHGVLDLEVRWSRDAVRYLRSFGLPIAVKQIFTYFTHRADEMIIAVTLPAATLGIYHLAKETLQRLQGLVTASFSRVLLPMFSRLKHDQERLSRSYYTVSLVLSYVGMSVFGGFAAVAHVAVPALFGTQWLDAIPIFERLSIALIPIVLTANVSSAVLYARGRSKQVLMIDFLVNIPYLLLLTIVSPLGVMAIVSTYVGYCFAKAIALQIWTNRELHLTWQEHVGLYARVGMRVAGMLAVVVLVARCIPDSWGRAVATAVLVLCGVVAMLILLRTTDRAAISTTRSILQKRPSAPGVPS